MTYANWSENLSGYENEISEMFKKVIKLNILNDVYKIKIIAEQFAEKEALKELKNWLDNYCPFYIQIFFIGGRFLSISDIELDDSDFEFKTSNINELKNIINKLNQEYNSYGLEFPEIGFMLVDRVRNEIFSFNYNLFQNIINEL